ncbi:hypothetical protein GCM10025864_28410 [Luteimicrobium album]|uniref:Bacterial Ig-like domain-containing protein n=1 Tax=Luteimicrobium album TaxID=1054550 RepID=A0ABQ6I4D7_9MICO|nr:hypothetical protein [Luteimicrobium album]GMA25082.1 hypothetical protein GCM10025864_28410 [Luteimicrobium album]
MRNRRLAASLLILVAGVLAPAVVVPTAAVADDTAPVQETCTQPYVVTFTQTKSYGRQFAGSGTVSTCATGDPATSGSVLLSDPTDRVVLATATVASGRYSWADAAAPAYGSTNDLDLTYDPGNGESVQSVPVTVTTTVPIVHVDLSAWIPSSGPADTPVRATVTVSTFDAKHTFLPWATVLAPTGTVDILRNGSVVGHVDLAGTSVTFPEWGAKSVGSTTLAGVRPTDSLTAVYHGDVGYPGASTDAPQPVKDERAPTTLTITGLTVSGLHAEVTAGLTAGRNAAGSSPEVGEVPLVVSVDGHKAATFSTYPWSQTSSWGFSLPGGAHTVAVAFAGNGTLQPSSASRTVTVPRVPTRTTLADLSGGSFGPVPRGATERLQVCVRSGSTMVKAGVRLQRRVGGAKTWKTVTSKTTSGAPAARRSRPGSTPRRSTVPSSSATPASSLRPRHRGACGPSVA